MPYVIVFERSNQPIRYSMRKLFIFAAVALLATSIYAIDGALPGKFTVSGGKTICFSMGNLQYQASTGTWRFAPRQYGVVGAAGNGNIAHPTIEGEKSDNLMISQSYDGWVDLFAWGTSGWNSGAEEYQPWSVGDESALYVPLTIREANPRPDNYNLVDEFANGDWGVYNRISNGGNRAGVWFTLSREDWRIITEERPNASEKIGKATVSGVRGMVLLPDEWSAPFGVTFESGWGHDWDTNSYSYAEWKPLEDAGAVFLPCAGCRTGREVEGLQTAGHYWSSSSDLSGGLKMAFDLYFNNWAHEMYTYDMRKWGESVRLVTIAH